MAERPRVDVVVPVLDGAGVLAGCLEALARQEGVDHHVYVVDNGSTDGSPDVATRSGATVLHEAVRSSYAARNTGWRVGTSPIVAFTDADCVPDPSWLIEGCAELAATGADAVAGRISHVPSATAMGRHEVLLYLDQRRYVEVIGFGATANLLVRRDVLESLDGFRPLRSGGDLELGLRLRATGRRVAYAADAVVFHRPRERVRDGMHKAWRIGTGHAAVGRDHPSFLRSMLTPRLLVPGRYELRLLWRTPRLLFLDVLLRTVEWTARWTAHLRDRAAS